MSMLEQPHLEGCASNSFTAAKAQHKQHQQMMTLLNEHSQLQAHQVWGHHSR